MQILLPHRTLTKLHGRYHGSYSFCCRCFVNPVSLAVIGPTLSGLTGLCRPVLRTVTPGRGLWQSVTLSQFSRRLVLREKQLVRNVNKAVHNLMGWPQFAPKSIAFAAI